MRRLYCLFVVALLLISMAITTAPANSLHSHSSLLTPHSSRPWSPVVLAASQLPDLLDAPLTHLVVWAYRDGEWRTIPWQVDEKDAGGYVAEGDGQFNGTDELVFMLDDMGELAPVALPPYAGVQVVNVADPLAIGTPPRIAYVTRVATPVPSPATDYIQYDTATQRLQSVRYSIGLHAERPFITYLALNGSAVNLIDRSKIRVILNVCFFGCLTLDETQLPSRPITPVKDGPIRVILDDDGGFAYRDWLHLRTVADLSDLPARVLNVQLRLDLAPAAQGAVYRDANRPAGVTIDGIPDDVPALPYSPWRQADHATGRLVSQFNVLTSARRLMNFYLDRATHDPEDTGDGLAYGEHGVVVDEPEGQTIAVDSALWLLPPDSPLDGPTLSAHYATPLAVTVTRLPSSRLYLPYVMRHP